MKKTYKRLLCLITALALLVTSMCGMALINAAAEDGGADDSETAVNFVSDNINNMVMFTNPDSSYGPWNVPQEYATVSGAANNVWYAWHNGAGSGTGFIASNTSVYRDNAASIKYVGNANSNTWMYYWLKLDPGDYSFSFWYKGVNCGNSKVAYEFSAADWDNVKDKNFYDNLSSYMTNIAASEVTLTDTSEWKEVKIEFTVSGDNAKAVQFGMAPARAADELYLADFAVEKVIKDEGGDAKPEDDADPDELLSYEVRNIEYFYNPDKGGISTADPSRTHMPVSEALNRNWYMWMRNIYLGHDISMVTDGHDEKAAIKISGIEDGNIHGAGLAYFDIQLEPGIYEFTYWTKCKDIYGKESPEVTVTASVYSLDKIDKSSIWPHSARTAKKYTSNPFDVPYYLDKSYFTTDWVQKTASFTISGDEDAIVNITLATGNVCGDIWFSDFSLKKTGNNSSSGDTDIYIDLLNPYDPYEDIYYLNYSNSNSDDYSDYSDNSYYSGDETSPETGVRSAYSVVWTMLIAAGFVSAVGICKLYLLQKNEGER